MADKLIQVNSRISVMASQVAYIIAPEFKDYIEVHLLDELTALKLWSVPATAGTIKTALKRLLTMR